MTNAWDRLPPQPSPLPPGTPPPLSVTRRPPEKFGCTPCHEGQGVALNSVEQAHGNVEFWNHPMLEGEQMQSRCIGCHACEAACSEKNENPGHIAFRSVGYVEGGCYPDYKRMNISSETVPDSSLQKFRGQLKEQA